MRPGEIESRPGALADRAVARILAQTSADETLYPQVLEAIGDSLGWELGLIWEAPASGDGPLTCAEVWCSPSAGDGYYYLVSGTCASPIGYGNSVQGSPPTGTPRVGLPGPGSPCP